MYHIKPEKRTRASAKLITEAVLQLMQEKPFEAITITDVQRVSTVSRSTFYRSFDRLEDVLELLCDEGFAEAFRQGGPTIPEAVFRYWSQNSLVLETLVRIHRTDILYNSLRRSAAGMAELRALIDDRNRYDYFAAIISSGMMGILIAWVEHGKTESADEVLEQVYYAIGAAVSLLSPQERQSRDDPAGSL